MNDKPVYRPPWWAFVVGGVLWIVIFGGLAILVAKCQP